MTTPAAPTHAGGVVFREDRSGIRYLIVSAKDDPAHRVFPKGHIETGESPEATALREVREEAGVEAGIFAPLDIQEFDGPDGPVRVANFLMRYVADAAPGEHRSVFWCAFEEARARLTFENSRETLARAHARTTRTRS